MSDFRFPSTIKPLTSKNYSYDLGDGVFQQSVDGGLPRSNRDRSLDTPTFSLNFTMDRFKFQIFNFFYKNKINKGASTFWMTLDSGNGLEEHHGLIIRNSIRISEPVNGIYYVAFQFRVEFIPSQITDDCPNLYDLYECYGDELPSILCNLDDLVENHL